MDKPEGFKYQAVLRDASNAVISNQAVGVRLTIEQGSAGGTVIYTETFSPTTNSYGLVNLEIGTGTTTDDFTTIDWANGTYFIETAIDAAGGSNYSVMGTSQLMTISQNDQVSFHLHILRDDLMCIFDISMAAT